MTRRVATPVDWLFAPDWLTVEQACRLSGWDVDAMTAIVNAGGVDLDGAGHIEKRSLWEFQEAVALVAHWDDRDPYPNGMDHNSAGSRVDGV